MFASEPLLVPVEDTSRLLLRCHSRVGYICCASARSGIFAHTFNGFVRAFVCHAAVPLCFFTKQIVPRENVETNLFDFPFGGTTAAVC